MQREMKVDDSFISAVLEKAGTHYPLDIIAATLSVAAERGLVVPEDAPRAWAVAGPNGEPSTVRLFATHTAASKYAIQGATVVRVAIVEIKEDGK